MTKVFEVDSIKNLPAAAKSILLHLNAKRVVAFYGDLGAGKTTLIKEICRQLGVKDHAASPSFAIMYEYALQDNNPVYHFDFYRINSESEAFDLGYENFFYSGYYCFIEWPEKIKNLLPENAAVIKIIRQNEKRIVSLTA